jgi:hypothetical protein
MTEERTADTFITQASTSTMQREENATKNNSATYATDGTHILSTYHAICTTKADSFPNDTHGQFTSEMCIYN